MKLFITILFPALLNAQLYMGSFLGYSHSSFYSKTERFTSEHLFFNMPIGYKSGPWLIESGGTYNGSIYCNLLAGRNFPLSETVSIDLLAGTSDALEISFNKLRIAQTFEPNITGRVRWKAFSLQGVYLQHGYLIGFGICGFINK